MPKAQTNLSGDSEDIFLSDVLRDYKFWKNKITERERQRLDCTKEKSYAEAYRLLLNQFTLVDEAKKE